MEKLENELIGKLKTTYQHHHNAVKMMEKVVDQGNHYYLESFIKTRDVNHTKQRVARGRGTSPQEVGGTSPLRSNSSNIGRIEGATPRS